MTNPDWNKLKGEGKNAISKLNGLSGDIISMNNKLCEIASSLNKIIENKLFPDKIGFKSKRLPIACNKNELPGIPQRISFNCIGLSFYIEFTVNVNVSDEMYSTEGCIIYGASRIMCFTDNIENNNEYDCKNCSLISRCDKKEDKPMISFIVNRYSMIRSVGNFENKSWFYCLNIGSKATKDEKKKEEESDLADLTDLHYRTMDKIWVDALAWSNEFILP